MRNLLPFSELSTFFDRKKLLNISFGFFIGLSIGYFIKDVFLWRRKEEGYLYEILKEIMFIKSEMMKVRLKMKKIETSIDTVDMNLTVDNDEFEDAKSSLDEVESFYSFVEDGTFDIENFIREIDEILIDTSLENYNRCFELCEHELWKFQDRSEFLWRFAMISYNTTLDPNMELEIKNRRIFAAFNTAMLAVKKAPNSSNAHKWLGILYGVTGLMSETKQRILNGYKFKEHIDRCIELNPNDAYAFLLKGRFCYQVSNLSFLERKLASILFETPPTATMEEALTCFQKCEELAPNRYGENHYFLSLYYRSIGDYVMSAKFLESGKALPCRDSEIQMKLENS